MQTIEIINKVTKLFNLHGWEIDKDGSFGRFCDALSFLPVTQQDCLLDISKNFLKVNLEKYLLYIKLAIAEIDDRKNRFLY